MKDAYERFLIDTKKKTGGKRRNPNVATSFPTYLVQALNKMLRNSTDKVVRALEDPKEFDEGDRALDADGHLNDSRVCSGYLIH